MSSIFGTSNDYYSGGIFGNYSSSNSNSYGIFGNTSNNILGDYSMIQSGAYKKLLRSYYKNTNADNKSDSTSTDKTDSTVETGKLLTVKKDSSALKDITDKLRASSLYAPTGQDENGKDVYDMDAIKENLKEFVKAYNSYIDSSSDVDTKGVLSKSLRIVKNTAANEKLLKSIGINIGEGNKLSFDEKKFDESAKISTLSSLFTGGSFSYGGIISDKASETYSAADKAANSNSGVSSYTYKPATLYTQKGSYSYTAKQNNNSLDAYL